MAFKSNPPNHSPQWYYEHCRAEDGGSPSFRKMLKDDVTFIDKAYWDSKLTYEENIEIYERAFNEALSDPSLGSVLAEVLEREALDGYTPHERYKDEPFTTIDRIIEEQGVTVEQIREYLNWRSRHGGWKERKETKAEEMEAQRWLREKKAKKFFG